jgi:Holliday junction resolvase RusA-like endonuclease
MSRDPPKSRTQDWIKTILGQPHSKANSRKIIRIKGKPAIAKSKPALGYAADFAAQCPTLSPLFEGPVLVEIDIYYGTRRPDLDESLILDAMQGRIFRNDRQVFRKVITKFIDPSNPRATIRVSALEECLGPMRQGHVRGRPDDTAGGVLLDGEPRLRNGV